MRYISHQDLDRLQTPMAKSEQLIKEASAHPDAQVLLSHSSIDRPRLGQIIGLFSTFKAPVYLDFQDESLPRVTSTETADSLRVAIRRCPRFVLVASSNIRDSRWTPWELGYADGVKGTAKVAILPLVPRSNEETSVEQEYLGLYPVIAVEKLDDKLQYAVRDPNDRRWWSLEVWLTKDVTLAGRV